MALSVRSSLAFSLVDRYLSLIVSIVSTMVLARLLTPAELGVYSVAMAMLAMAAVLRDLGAGNYLVQEKDLTIDRIRAVWAVQLAVGAALAVIVAALSLPAARFFKEPDVQSILLLLSLTYLVTPFGSLTYAWLMREMRFDAIAVMRLSSTLSGAAVSIVLAWRGHGAVSLAWGSLVAALANAGVSMLFRPAHFPWLPGTRDVRRVLSFGMQLTGSSAATAVSTAAPEFLLGKLQGMAFAGYYSRANGFVALFNRLIVDAVYPVAQSLFAQHARSGQPYGEPFLRAMSYLSALCWSFTIGLVLLAHPATLLLYGDQWGPSVPLTRWLACAAALAVPLPLCTAALLGAGQLKPLMHSTLVMAGATVVAAGIGAALGLAAIGPAMLVASGVGTIAWLRNTQRLAGFRWSALARCGLHSAFVALATGAGPLVAVQVFGWTPASSMLPLLVGCSTGVIGFVCAVMLTGHPLASEFKIVAALLIRNMKIR